MYRCSCLLLLFSIHLLFSCPNCVSFFLLQLNHYHTGKYRIPALQLVYTLDQEKKKTKCAQFRSQSNPKTLGSAASFPEQGPDWGHSNTNLLNGSPHQTITGNQAEETKEKRRKSAHCPERWLVHQLRCRGDPVCTSYNFTPSPKVAHRPI